MGGVNQITEVASLLRYVGTIGEEDLRMTPEQAREIFQKNLKKYERKGKKND